MKEIQVTIDNYITIQNPSDIPPRVEMDLVNELSRANPELHLKKSLGIWTGNIPKTLRLYRYVSVFTEREDKKGLDSHQILCIDRGCWQVLVDVFETNKIKYRVKNNLVENFILGFPEFSGVLEDYQRDALEKVTSTKSQGIICFPTGGGKTVWATALIAKLEQKTTILVHTTELLGQWIDSLERFIPGINVGQYSGTKKIIGEHATVAMVQSLSRDCPAEIHRDTGLLIMDELQHIGANTFQDVVGLFPAKYRYGLTATPDRRDGKAFYIHSIFGDTLVKLGYKDVGSRIILPIIYPIVTALAEDYTSLYSSRGGEVVFDYVGAYTKLANDYLRNSLILQLILELLEKDDSYILVLTKRRENAKFLNEFLNQSGVKSSVLLGGGSAKDKREKKEILEQSRSGENRVIIGTSIAEEGVDVVRLNKLILAAPGSYYGLLAQRMGRIMRNHEGKEPPWVFDLVDLDVPEFLTAWRKRKDFCEKHEMKIDYGRCKPEEINILEETV